MTPRLLPDSTSFSAGNPIDSVLPPPFKPHAKTMKKKTSTAPRIFGFCQKKTDFLLDLMDKYLPIGSEEWAALLSEHKKTFSQRERSVESLKRKFFSLHRHRMQTEDPLIPYYVHRAKSIRDLITKRAEIAVDEDIEDAVEVSFNETQLSTLVETDREGAHDTNETKDVIAEKTLVQTPLRIARPLVRPCPMMRGKDNRDDIMDLFRLSILNDQKRREEDLESRKEEREENRLQCLDESRRHEKLTEMMLMLVAKTSKSQ